MSNKLKLSAAVILSTTAVLTMYYFWKTTMVAGWIILWHNWDDLDWEQRWLYFRWMWM